MARAVEATNGSFLIRALAIGGVGIAIGVGTFGIKYSLENRERIAVLEAKDDLGDKIDAGFARIEQAIRETR